MPRYTMLAMTRPAEGREAEYNDWYQNVHLPEVVGLPGIRSARRMRLARNVGASIGAPYLAVYDIETDDIDAALVDLASAAMDGRLHMSDALSQDPADRFAAVYEEFGEPVTRA